MWSQSKYLLRSEAGTLQGPPGEPGGALVDRGVYAAGTAYDANDSVLSSENRRFLAVQATTGHAPPAYPDVANAYWSLVAERGLDGTSGTKTLWDDMPGTPARVSDTSFRIVDTGHANGYDLIYTPGMIVSWQKSGGGWQAAKILTATYSANYVTFTIIGNTLAALFTNMKYCIHRAQEDRWIIPGNMPANTPTTNIGKAIIWREDRYVFSAVVAYQTAPSDDPGIWDINDDGTSIFTTKPQIHDSVEGTETVCNSLSGTATTAVAAKSQLTLDYDGGDTTTCGADAYVFIFSMPMAWRYTP